jgi:uncharacterized membrane protein
LTEGENAISQKRHAEMLDEEREKHREVIKQAFDTIAQLSERLSELQNLLDDDWIDGISRDILQSIEDTDGQLTPEAIREIIKDTMDNEIEKRSKINKTIDKGGGGVGAGAWDVDPS